MRNPNRGIVLRLHHAAAIHRVLEYHLTGRQFDNPIVAAETFEAAGDALQQLGEKLLAVFEAHSARVAGGAS